MYPDKNTEITIAAEGVVTIPTADYERLVACQTILDMIMASRSESGYVDSSVVKCAYMLRSLQVAPPPSCNAETPDGEEDA